MKQAAPEARSRRRFFCGVLALCGFLLTCALAYRDSHAGYELRVWNRTEFPMEVYLVNETTTHLFDVWHGEVNRPYLLDRNDAGELVFAPRGTGRRISRIELPAAALRTTGRPNGSLFIELRPTDYLLSDGREWGIAPPLNLPPEAPLLYCGVLGWLTTLARWRQRQ